MHNTLFPRRVSTGAASLERISRECTAYSQTLDARFREHDEQEVIPAHARIQEPYRQSRAALGQVFLVHAVGLDVLRP